MTELPHRRLFLLTLRAPITLEIIEQLEYVALPTPEGEIPPPPPAPGEPPGGAPAPGAFPWVGAGPIGPFFDRAPDFLKDAISWFFPRDAWACAACISSCETVGWTAFVHDTRGRTDLPPGTSPEYSIGWWQINVLAHGDRWIVDGMNAWLSTQWAADRWRARGGFALDWVYCARNCGCA